MESKLKEGGGKLTLVSTPIGNLGDLSQRAVQALSEADVWFVEDSRVSGKLAAHLGLKKPMRLLTDRSPEPIVAKYVEEIAGGASACVLTDGGSPAISDPGARLCDLCRESDLEIDAIPGPSAVTTALALSGFYAQRFAFLGFMPRKQGPFRAELAPYRQSTLTLVLFESPFRFIEALNWAGAELGPRRYALCREMTKAYQQVFRGVLPVGPTEGEAPRKGEITLVIEGLRKTQLSP